MGVKQGDAVFVEVGVRRGAKFKAGYERKRLKLGSVHMSITATSKHQTQLCVPVRQTYAKSNVGKNYEFRRGIRS